MTLHQIIRALQEAQGSKNKLAILEANKDNELLKQYMKAVLDPSINFFQKKAPKPESSYDEALKEVNINGIVHMLSTRKVSGKEAIVWLKNEMEAYTPESQELIAMMIGRSIEANVAESMVLKVWPGLFFVPPYCRCSLFDEKIKEKFSKIPVMYVQKKLDGLYCALVKEEGQLPKAITRAGGHFPQWFANQLAKDCDDNIVGLGEIEVFSSGELMDRQTGNGILNSILKGAEEHEYSHLEFRLTCWDMLTPEEFKAGKSLRTYKSRLESLWESGLDFINTDVVSSVQEAYGIYSSFTAQGCEGAVLKNPMAIWSDGTSKDMVKLKIKFECDVLVTGIYEGEGKAKGSLGGVNIQTLEGNIKSNCGSGFTDKDRERFFKHPEEIVGKIITISANDVISKRDSDVLSFFLPIYEDLRFDKDEADTMEQVYAQLNAAKNGGMQCK